MEKLTASQVEKLAIVLTAQFEGKIILLGSSSYNEGKVYAGVTEWIKQNNKNHFKVTHELGGKTFGNNIKGLSVWNWLNLSWSPFFKPKTINVELLKNNYSNGIEVINKALNNL